MYSSQKYMGIHGRYDKPILIVADRLKQGEVLVFLPGIMGPD
jgi:hypothetical protein